MAEDKVADYPSRASTSQNELNSRLRRSYCYECGSMGHETKDCPISRRASSSHNNGQENEVLVALRLKIGKSHTRCKCRGGQKRRRLKQNGYFGIEDWKKDQSV